MNFYKKNTHYFFHESSQKNGPHFFIGVILIFIGASILSRTLLGTSLPVDVALGGFILYFGVKIICKSHKKML